MRILRRLLVLAKMPATRIAASVFLGAGVIATGVGLMATAGYLISRAAEHPPVLSLTVAIVAVRFFGLARPITRYFERIVSHDLALRALGRVRTHVYVRIEPLAPAELESYRDGDLLTRMVADVDALQGLYLRGVGPPLVALVAGTGCVVTAAVMSPAAAEILALGLIVAGVVVPVLAGTTTKASGARQALARSDLTADLVELLNGAPELVVYGAEDATMARLREHDRRLARLARRDALTSGLAEAFVILLTGLTVAGVLAVAASQHAAGNLDRVLIATLALLAFASFEAVIPLPSAARDISATLASGRRVLGLIEREPTVRDPERPLTAPTGTATVRLEAVTARYPGNESPVFSGLDLALEPGSRVALVGASGSGKTTVTNLLLRFLAPEEGHVTLAGKDLDAYRQDDVRRTFALAGQEAYVFDSTIRANLLVARPDATDEELEDVLRSARLDAWVASMPDGLHTPVGEGGRQLSGGQRQRLTVARALLVRAPVLILDEPTSHLDPATAEDLVRDVFAAAGDRSVLLITHRSEGLDLVNEVVSLSSPS
jgi:thiol reductant ABC exporter CydC subunit